MKLDLNGNKCHKKEVKIGIAKSLLMDKLKVKKDFFNGDVSKPRKRSHLKCKLTRAISALKLITSNSNLAEIRMADFLITRHESCYYEI